MLLAVSVGNSHITFGVHDNGAWTRRWRIQTVHAKTSDEYLVIVRTLLEGAGILGGRIDASILSSVVPPLTGTMVEAIRELTGLSPSSSLPHWTLGFGSPRRIPRRSARTSWPMPSRPSTGSREAASSWISAPP